MSIVDSTVPPWYSEYLDSLIKIVHQAVWQKLNQMVVGDHNETLNALLYKGKGDHKISTTTRGICLKEIYAKVMSSII
jgi:hypothetical protein